MHPTISGNFYFKVKDKKPRNLKLSKELAKLAAKKDFMRPNSIAIDSSSANFIIAVKKFIDLFGPVLTNMKFEKILKIFVEFLIYFSFYPKWYGLNLAIARIHPLRWLFSLFLLRLDQSILILAFLMYAFFLFVCIVFFPKTKILFNWIGPYFLTNWSFAKSQLTNQLFSQTVSFKEIE